MVHDPDLTEPPAGRLRRWAVVSLGASLAVLVLVVVGFFVFVDRTAPTTPAVCRPLRLDRLEPLMGKPLATADTLSRPGRNCFIETEEGAASVSVSLDEDGREGLGPYRQRWTGNGEAVFDVAGIGDEAIWVHDDTSHLKRGRVPGQGALAVLTGPRLILVIVEARHLAPEAARQMAEQAARQALAAG